jgi:pimeloyl-ACP methyl ester carboxylesterase
VRCRAYEQAFAASEVASATSCARELGARRSFYTSADVAADIDAVRRRLGVPKIAVYGVSYGTRVALEYARRYPQHTDRIILDSPLEAGGTDPFSLATVQAIPRVLHRICEYGCGGIEHPVADLGKLAAQLRAKPLERVVRDGRSSITVQITEDDLYTLLVTTDLFVPLMQAVPIVVDEALKALRVAHRAVARGPTSSTRSGRCATSAPACSRRRCARSPRPPGTARRRRRRATPRCRRRWRPCPTPR